MIEIIIALLIYDTGKFIIKTIIGTIMKRSNRVMDWVNKEAWFTQLILYSQIP